MTSPPNKMVTSLENHHSLLEEPLIRYRRASDGAVVPASLPELLVALAEDSVRDFPALRPHQRHPWHAFLTQLAAIALRATDRSEPFLTATEWQSALLALTPEDKDGAAWCLVTPHSRPAFFQAANLEGTTAAWKGRYQTPDELDILVTSKNHDLKASRAVDAGIDAWIFALVSLQTQEGVLGAGNYGISRMNGGFASRPGVGVAPKGNWGKRWCNDLSVLLRHRAMIAAKFGLKESGGNAILWQLPWDGKSTLSFSSLDPFYIEICRRVRLSMEAGRIFAIATGSSSARIDATSLKGVTGDPWTPIDLSAGKALTITGKGFGYELLVDLMFRGAYEPGVAQSIVDSPNGAQRFELIARGIARGKGKTEGFHERRVPISPKVRSLLLSGQRDRLAKIASERIHAIAETRKLLWLSLVVLFDNGTSKGDASDPVKERAKIFSQPFEQIEDLRFFDDLNAEVDADNPEVERLAWEVRLANSAEHLLRSAFVAGPQSAMRRYRAQSAALRRFHGGLRRSGGKSPPPLPNLSEHFRSQSASRSAQPETIGGGHSNADLD